MIARLLFILFLAGALTGSVYAQEESSDPSDVRMAAVEASLEPVSESDGENEMEEESEVPEEEGNLEDLLDESEAAVAEGEEVEGEPQEEKKADKKKKGSDWEEGPVFDAFDLEQPKYKTLFFDGQEMRNIVSSIELHREVIEARWMRANNKVVTQQAVTLQKNGKPVTTVGAGGSKKAGKGFSAQVKNALPRPPRQPKPYKIRHPQYHLASLVYRSPREWMVLINGKKFTHEEKTIGDLTVTFINPKGVKLLWKPKVYIAYKNRKRRSRWGSVSHNAKQEYFTLWLEPNQTFTARYLDVVEGKLPPSVEEIMMFSPDDVPPDMQPYLPPSQKNAAQ